MKKAFLILTTLLISFSTMSCNKNYMYPDYDGTEKETPGPGTGEPELPVETTLTTSIRDLVLIYGGGSDRAQTWNKDAFYPYVAAANNTAYDWMFDGFLFLELNDGKGHAFTTGHAPDPALKVHWQEMIDKYFAENLSIGALDQCVDGVIQKGTTLSRKRRISIGIPEPIKTATAWGEVNGKMLDFSKDEDRITACKWFVDEVSKKFQERKYNHLELDGFYWIAEEVENTGTMIAAIGDYVQKKTLTFVWIPWWKSPGYNNYKPYKFTDVYLQPNYFFYDVPYSRLQDACDEAKKFKINLEIEFSEEVLGGRGQKLYDYLEVFEKNDVYNTMKLAYYQSENTILRLYQSTNTADQELYKLLKDIVTKRQKVENPPYLKN
ncbi:MAG: DUF4855 domain-containing protein [Pedobacter sp.]|uniref:DUF4855 domain-containing protein n=1 Tax=Pedobacter sp. TaxID=1411316 RepID=UPI00356A020D